MKVEHVLEPKNLTKYGQKSLFFFDIHSLGQVHQVKIKGNIVAIYSIYKNQNGSVIGQTNNR